MDSAPLPIYRKGRALRNNPDIEKYRVTKGLYASDSTYGQNGAFVIPFQGRDLFVIASDEGQWDHVSISLKNRTPNWKEMCFIKDLFWDNEETVWQYHPPRSQYVNDCENCLHLWKLQGFDMPLPPSIFVGLSAVTATKKV